MYNALFIMRTLFIIGIFVLVSLPAEATIDVTLQMQLGNPSGAAADTNNHSHYLIQPTVEAIDYSDQLGEAVWASWDLTAGDVGGSGRNSTYYPDTNLPPNFYHVTTTNYNGVGTNNFNRGHLCPSDDRTDSTNDNKLVFYMSNIFPQSALNNQGVWGNFEDYCRYHGGRTRGD
jgi:DNA/RNA endonuclease G (NUC1)